MERFTLRLDLTPRPITVAPLYLVLRSPHGAMAGYPRYVVYGSRYLYIHDSSCTPFLLVTVVVDWTYLRFIAHLLFVPRVDCYCYGTVDGLVGLVTVPRSRLRFGVPDFTDEFAPDTLLI